MSKRKIALAGIGKIALDQHVPSINASPDWELAATVSRHGRVDGVEAFERIEDLLEARPDIEVISLCMPPAPRFSYAAAALRAGRHVMLEKPPGATLAECHALEAMARQAGVTLFASWHSRMADKVSAAKEWLAGKRVEGFTITWKEDVRRWHPGQDWVFEPGGLGVFDPGINALSVLTEILPKPVHVTKALLETPENRQTPIAASVTFFYPGAVVGRAELDWRQRGEQTWNIEVLTDAGFLKLVDGGARMQVNGREPVHPDEPPLTGEYPRLYARMAELVNARRIDMDLRPMVLVADALALGERKSVEPFNW